MRSYVCHLVLLAGLFTLPLQARAQGIILQRCNSDPLTASQAEARLGWMRRCALTVNVRNPGAGFDTGMPAANGGNLIDYAEDSTTTNWSGVNRYIAQSDAFEINNSYITKLYLSGMTSQVVDANGYYQWSRALSRRKARPLYPIYGSQYDINIATPLYPHPTLANCAFYLDRNGTQPATGYNFYVNGFCEAFAETALSSGTPVSSLADVAGSTRLYSLTVPAGATNLVFETSGATGDVDLAVRFNAAPTSTVYECRPFRASGNERCVISNPSAGTWYASLNGYTSYSGVSLKGEWNVLLRGAPMSNLAGAQGSEQRWTMQVPAGLSSLTFTLAPQADAVGDADLYVQFGSAPTTGSFTCRPYLDGNNEVCTFSNPAAGTWHVMLRGWSNYSGVMLTGSY